MIKSLNMRTLRYLIISFILATTLSLSAKDYKASLFGVKSDGATLNTRSIQKAVDFISEKGGGRLVFYVGRYLTGSIQLKSNVTIQLEEGAILVGTASVYDYMPVAGMKALITADRQQNIGITGKGVIDGQGAALMETINAQIRQGYLKETADKAVPALIAMDSCSQVTMEQVNLLNACGTVQSFISCRNISVSGVTVKSTAVKGSTGIRLSGCDGVKLENSWFDTSGVELESAGNSKNVTVIGCRNAKGKKLQVKN